MVNLAFHHFTSYASLNVRSGFIRRLACVLGVASLVTPGSAGWAADLTASPRPNVVVLLADDLGYGDLGCYGNSQIDTPHLDGLADQSMRCTSFYAAAPMCSPSRAGLLTGRSPNRTGIYDWIAHDGTSTIHLLSEEITFASLLRSAGYQTALHGKWHLNSSFNSADQPQPDGHGFDYWFATQFNPAHRNPTGFVRNGVELAAQDGYSCDVVVNDAITWLHHQVTNQPFFQFVCFHEPHHPVESPPQLVQKYVDAGAENREQATYFASVENLDTAVGRYLSALDELRLTENTLLIFTSDHGPQTLGPGVFRHSYGSAGAFRGRKRHLWEGGLRVPGIVRWPRMTPQPQVIETPIGFVDLLPTLASICGYDIPQDREMDGCDVSQILFGEQARRATTLHWHFYAPLSGPQSVLRSGQWVLTASWNVGTEPFRKGTRHIPEFEDHIKRSELENYQLFDVATDEHQDTDVAAQHPEVVAQLSHQLAQLHLDVRDDAPIWNQAPHRR